MDCPDEPGVCSGEAPAIMPQGVGGPENEGLITGTRVYVWQVVEALDRHGSEARAARELGLSEHQVRVALEYHWRNSASR